MGKDKRFPSDANKPKSGEKPKAAPAPQKPVQASATPVVPVLYKKENNHILQGPHALAPGLNQVAKHVWEEAKKHPSVQKLIKDGHAVENPGAEEAEEPAESQEDADSEGADLASTEGDQKPSDSKE